MAASRSRFRNRIKEHVMVAGRDLIPNPDNWRVHPPEQREAMTAILEEIGIIDELIVVRRRGKYHLVDGHMRADLDPDELYPCTVVDLTEAEARSAIATFDWIRDLAERDVATLSGLFESAVDNERLRELFESSLDGEYAPLDPRPGQTDPDDVPEPPEAPVTQPGDLWMLGDHTLLCGDATEPDDWARLMDGGAAAMLWTDPPYGVAYTGGTKRKLKITNDANQDEALALFRDVLPLIDAALAPGAPFYVAHPSGGDKQIEFARAINEQGWKIHETLIWVKDTMVLGHSDYHYRHEPIFYGARDGEEPPWHGDYMEAVQTYEPVLYGWTAGAPHPWYGRRSETTVLFVDRPKASRDHPTMKPVGLIVRMMHNSSAPGGLVLDPFAGSGSTLIAAEQLERRALCMEIDPRYCDVIVRRWEDFTGHKAARKRSGGSP